MSDIHRVEIGNLTAAFPQRNSDELGPLVHRLLVKLSSRFTSLAAQLMDLKQIAQDVMDENKSEEESMSNIGALVMDGLGRVDWQKVAGDVEAIIGELSYADIKLLARGALVSIDGGPTQSMGEAAVWNKVTRGKHGLVYRLAKEAIVAEGLLDFISHWAGSAPRD